MSDLDHMNTRALEDAAALTLPEDQWRRFVLRRLGVLDSRPARVMRWLLPISMLLLAMIELWRG